MKHMRKERYFFCIALLAALGGLLTACTVEEGDERPRRTQGEYAVYSSVYLLHGRAVENLRLAAGFDAYLRQTTDAGRAAVAARFFPWVRIIEQKNYGWRLLYGESEEMYYDFILKDGLLLGEPGASWLCYWRYSAEPSVQLICDLSTEGDVVRYKGRPFEDNRVDWLVGVTLTDSDFSVSIAGDSNFEYKSGRWNEDCWTVDCRIDAPLQWSYCNGGMTAGTMSVKAVLSAERPRTIAFRAEHVRGGLQIIAEDGFKENWNWWIDICNTILKN